MSVQQWGTTSKICTFGGENVFEDHEYFYSITKFSISLCTGLNSIHDLDEVHRKILKTFYRIDQLGG